MIESDKQHESSFLSNTNQINPLRIDNHRLILVKSDILYCDKTSFSYT